MQKNEQKHILVTWGALRSFVCTFFNFAPLNLLISVSSADRSLAAFFVSGGGAGAARPPEGIGGGGGGGGILSGQPQFNIWMKFM